MTHWYPAASVSCSTANIHKCIVKVKDISQMYQQQKVNMKNTSLYLHLKLQPANNISTQPSTLVKITRMDFTNSQCP
jgi:hypothetical protein